MHECLSDIVLMFSAGIFYLLIRDLLENKLDSSRIIIYVTGSIVVLLAVAVTQHIQYNATFLSTYKESGVRRTAIAEKLRKLPLSYFGKKDLSDLTTNIMSDCARMETASSHWIPELIGSVIATFIIDISLFALFDWSLALASFWVIPVSFLVLMTSSGGERQRISIARALLKDAPIILLDEATASLDVENETKIQQALSHLVKDKTVLIIAHRMRTIANAAWSSDGLCWNYFFFFTIPIPISKALMRIPATRRMTYTLAFTLRSVVQVEKFAWRMVSCVV